MDEWYHTISVHCAGLSWRSNVFCQCSGIVLVGIGEGVFQWSRLHSFALSLVEIYDFGKVSERNAYPGPYRGRHSDLRHLFLGNRLADWF